MPMKTNVRTVYKDGSLTPLGYVDIEECTIGRAMFNEQILPLLDPYR